jgi:tripartite-type tricarboxylate transporter receptor subunit TctC
MGSELMNAICKACVSVVICAWAVTAVFLSAAPALTQTYPTQRVQILVPFSAGTVLDTSPESRRIASAPNSASRWWS